MSIERPPYHIIVKIFKGQASADEQGLLSLWVRTSRSNKEEYKRLKAIWNAYGKHHESYVVDGAKGSSNLKSTLASSGNRPKLLYRIAASIAILFLIGLALYQTSLNWAGSDKVFTSNVDGKEVTLPDGSMVVMREGSKIVLDDNFNQQTRNLLLEGEAFFDVAKDKDRPFVVDNGSMKVAVLGTTFLITPFNLRTEVALYSGEVKVYKGDQQLSLHPNETAIVERTLTKKKEVNHNNLSWKTGKLNFQNQKLSQVFETLNRHYKLKIQSDKDIGEKRLTAVFEDQPIDEVLLVISNTHQLRTIKKDKKNYYLLEK